MGMPKTGKTHFSLTFPDPICLYSFDFGADYVAGKFSAKQIEIRKFQPPIVASVRPGKDIIQLRDAFRADFEKALGQGFNTIIIDTATALWEIIRWAFTEERNRNQLLARDYGEPNAQMTYSILQPQYLGINIVLINYLTERWVDDKNTGELKLDGFKKTNGLADIVLQTDREGKKMRSFIEVCRFDPELNGEELEPPTYDTLMELLGV